MTRSKVVREEVLRLDNYHCQITGFDGRDLGDRPRLAVHHRISIGGSGEKVDTVANGITLRNDIHTPFVHDRALTIDKWDRDAGILEVYDHQGVLISEPGPVRHDDLWFHRVGWKQEGEQITTRLGAYALIELDVARDAYRLKHRFHLLDSKATFVEYLAGHGLALALNDAALLYARSLELDFEWKDGVTATDYRRKLKDAGLIPQRKFWHVSLKSNRVLRAMIKLGWIGFVYCTSDEFADAGLIGFKAGKRFILRSVKGKLLLDGKELPYTVLEEEDAAIQT